MLLIPMVITSIHNHKIMLFPIYQFLFSNLEGSQCRAKDIKRFHWVDRKKIFKTFNFDRSLNLYAFIQPHNFVHYTCKINKCPLHSSWIHSKVELISDILVGKWKLLLYPMDFACQNLNKKSEFKIYTLKMFSYVVACLSSVLIPVLTWNLVHILFFTRQR